MKNAKKKKSCLRFAKYSCTYSEFSFRKRDDNGNILIADSRVMASADTGGSIEDLCYAYVFESVVSPRVRGPRLSSFGAKISRTIMSPCSRSYRCGDERETDVRRRSRTGLSYRQDLAVTKMSTEAFCVTDRAKAVDGFLFQTGWPQKFYILYEMTIIETRTQYVLRNILYTWILCS